MVRRAPELPEAVRRLDLTVLHTLLLGDRLGLDAGKLERKENITYFKEAAEALAAAERGVDGTQLAVLCRATPAAEVLAVVQTRHRMPQKSTYFYPKVPSGLVLRVLE